MGALDLTTFRAARLAREPFPYVVLPGFVKSDALAAIHADYPQIDHPGSFPIQELKYGPSFAALAQFLTGPQMREAFADKFGVDLTGRPTMLTVRGMCGTRDGGIHTDSVSKILTVLIYMNARWEHAGGRLRLLRSADDIEDVIVEAPPVEGTLVAFRRSDNSWHGHKPFVGPRRVIQLNWVTDRVSAGREVLRHRASAWVKWMVGAFRRRSA